MKYVPFSEDEMKVVGEYLRPTEPVGMPATPKLNTPVTPKENVRAAWKHEGALWIPSVGRDTICLEPRINVDHVARAEVRDLEPPYTDETKGGPDLFGVIWEYVPVVGGSMVQPGNPVLEDVNDWPEIIKFPDIEAMDWAHCKAVNAPFYTNHDMARGAGYYGYDKGGRTKLALGLNLMMTGNAFIYYGEEIGMKGSGKDENKRAPMYWSADGSEEGMCSGPPDMDSFDQKFDSVKAQLEDPDSILNYCRAAIRIRKAFPVIARGATVPQEEWLNETICAFTREGEEMEPVLILINTSEAAQTVDLQESPYKQIAGVLASASDKAVLKGTKLTVPALGIVILRQQ